MSSQVIYVQHLCPRHNRIYTKKKKALLQGDEALAMQVGEGKDIMSVLRESESTRSNWDFNANFGMRTVSAGEHGGG